MTRPEYHEKKDRDRLFRNTLKDPENGIRDHAILRFMYEAPIRSLEIARLMTHDLVNDQGQVTKLSCVDLRPEITFSGHSRPLPLTAPNLKSALQAWIEFRLEQKYGVTETGYIDLNVPFFLRTKTEGFNITTTYTDNKPRHNVESLNRIIRNRMKANGLTGNIESALRTWTLDRHREERCIKRIWLYRGDKSIDTVRNVIKKDPVRLGALTEQAY